MIPSDPVKSKIYIQVTTAGQAAGDTPAPRRPQWAQISIRDTGKGIPAQFLPHVFDRFCQEDTTIARKFGGLGLSLSIVRNLLVELHGGTVEAMSPGEDQGATFVVSLPILASQTLDTADTFATTPSVEVLNGRRILVAHVAKPIEQDKLVKAILRALAEAGQS